MGTSELQLVDILKSPLKSYCDAAEGLLRLLKVDSVLEAALGGVIIQLPVDYGCWSLAWRLVRQATVSARGPDSLGELLKAGCPTLYDEVSDKVKGTERWAHWRTEYMGQLPGGVTEAEVLNNYIGAACSRFYPVCGPLHCKLNAGV
jgi:hypothetical protein